MYAEPNRERSEAHKMAEGHARNEAEVWLRHDTIVIANEATHFEPPPTYNYQNLPNGLKPTAPPILLTAKPTTQVKHGCRAPPMVFVLYQSV